MSSFGFYPVDPVSGNYVFGTPLVDRAEIELGNNKKLTIEVKRTSPSDPYIQSVKLNGKLHHKLWFTHSDIANGAIIEFTMGPQPNVQFGAGEEGIPPSLTS
jgi:putative alpha-1,2-mannosidase